MARSRAATEVAMIRTRSTKRRSRVGPYGAAGGTPARVSRCAKPKEQDMGQLLSRFTIGIGLLVIVMAGLTACSAPPAAPPASQKSATGSPARAGRRDERAGAATAVAVAGCDAYAAWAKDPGIKAALKNTDLWPELIAAGNKAAGGAAVDQARMKQIDAQISRAANTIRNSAAASGAEELTQSASRAMGLASRLAAGLADGSLNQESASDAVAKLNDAIAAYETETAAQQARCG
jgi:hypothetical protein